MSVLEREISDAVEQAEDAARARQEVCGDKRQHSRPPKPKEE